MRPIPVPTLNEDQLIRQVLGGSRAALDLLYLRTKDRVLTILYHLSGDAHTAEDLMHETYLKLWERREQIDVEQSPMAYLVAVARNLWLNERERRGTFRRVVSSLGQRSPLAPEVDRSERFHIVTRAIGGLPEELREVLTLHRHAGLTYARIADLLGVSVKTVEARMTRAFEGLREALLPHFKELNHDLR